ncbi:hypothetical protein Syun_018419 [Stephania yunnanensis]|uniref:Gamma-glutamylcyclotransferase family protein n=1 Tax=Stephania yunnanensis TaxID=152371 RepID=A0AAP0NV03_9MAGN
MEQLITQGEAEFLGTHSTAQSYPLVCGPYRIPFLLNLPGRGRRVIGELYAVSGAALDRIDELEGTTAGHYERLPIAVAAVAGEEAVAAEAYYGHRSYGEAMWRRCGERGHGEYTAEVADGYVWRKDRPVGVSFLQRISLFVSSSDYD